MKLAIIWFGLGLVEGFILADWVRSRFEVRKGRTSALNSSQRAMRRETTAKNGVSKSAKHNKAVELLS